MLPELFDSGVPRKESEIVGKFFASEVFIDRTEGWRVKGRLDEGVMLILSVPRFDYISSCLFERDPLLIIASAGQSVLYRGR